MTIVNENEYNEWKEKNYDSYGSATFRFAECWANLMEDRMNLSELSPKDFIIKNAESLGHEADTEGITGFMYGYAVFILSKHWKYGESLRKWHNKEYGQEDCDGVVNPAILTVK